MFVKLLTLIEKKTLKTFKFFSQIDATDCGPAALRMVANYYGRHYNMESLRERCEKGIIY